MEANALITAVGNAITSVIGWCGTTLDALMTGELATLLPLFAIGIGISAIMLGIKIVRSFIWGA